MHNFKSYAKFKREYCLHITNKVPFYYLHIRPSPFSRNLFICPFPQAQYCHFKFPFKEHLHVHKSCTIRPNSIIDNRNKLLPYELYVSCNGHECLIHWAPEETRRKTVRIKQPTCKKECHFQNENSE